jgi:hypothetical protein
MLAPRDREGLRVVAVAEVVEPSAPALAEALAELEPHHGVALLAAVRDRELRDEQDRHRHAVGHVPLVRADVEGRILGGEDRGVALHVVDSRVDPGDVLEDVLLPARAGLAELGREVVELLTQLLVGEVLVGELLAVHLGAVGADQLGERALRGVAEDVHREQPLLRGGVPGAEHHVRARVAVDVRHRELAVAEDLHARPR